jgi:hypothetical protein
MQHVIHYKSTKSMLYCMKSLSVVDNIISLLQPIHIKSLIRQLI